MTKFESIGVARQYESRNIREAKMQFERSCNFCCNCGMHLECPGCSIAFAHEVISTYFVARKQREM